LLKGKRMKVRVSVYHRLPADLRSSLTPLSLEKGEASG
jgi:hypothetical protein